MDNGYRLIVSGDNTEVYEVLAKYDWRTDDKETRRHYLDRAIDDRNVDDDDVAVYRIYIDCLAVLGDLLKLYSDTRRFGVGLACWCDGGEASTEYMLESRHGKTSGYVIHVRSKLGTNAEKIERAARKALAELAKALPKREEG